jgi:GTP-binding protein
MRVTTGQLNRVIAQATQAHAPKSASGDRAVTVLYATQVRVSPPTFLLQLNHPVDLHFSYRRYLENKLRAAFGFEGTPIVLKVRTREH